LAYAQHSFLFAMLRSLVFPAAKGAKAMGVHYRKYFEPITLETIAFIFALVCLFLIVLGRYLACGRLSIVSKNGRLVPMSRRVLRRILSSRSMMESIRIWRSGLMRVRR
jgi:hypothetical protein